MIIDDVNHNDCLKLQKVGFIVIEKILLCSLLAYFITEDPGPD